MELNDLIKRNYDATVRRGQISSKTTNDDFYKKLLEEVGEVKESMSRTHKEFPLDEMEVIDIILVCATRLHTLGFNVEKLLKEKVVFNENRED